MIEIKDSIRHQNKITSGWLIHYRQRKKEHEEKKLEISARKQRTGGLSTGLSKPTEYIAVNLVDHDCFSNSAKWLEAIEEAEKMLSFRKRLLLKLRQETGIYVPCGSGRPGWIARVQVKLGEVENWSPAEQVLRGMWNDIINLTVRLALMKKCKF